jgi:hypothetical protein
LLFQAHARWVVLAIADADYAERVGRVDFRRGTVLFHGPPQAACDFLRERGLPVPRSLRAAVAGDWEAAAADDHGVAVAGWDGRARAGDAGVAVVNAGEAVAGDRGVAVSRFGAVRAGERGFAIAVCGREATAGPGGLARADEFGTATAGPGGTALCEGGTAAVGDSGLAVASGSGRAVAGAGGVAVAWGGRWPGVVQAGEGGVLVARWHDGERLRLAVAHVGEDGIRPDTPYALDEQGRFVAVESPGDAADAPETPEV